MSSQRAVPVIPAELTPQFVTFKAERKSYVLHNAKKRPSEVMFSGNLFTIPAVNVIGPYAETDADGDKIPGTRVVEDIYDWIPEWEEEVLTLDATKTVRHVLGIARSSDGKVAEATSRYALGGLSLLPRHPTKALWHGVAEGGAGRAFLIEVDNAQTLIQSIDEKNAKRKAAGMEPVHGGREYNQAVALLAEYAKLTQSEAREITAPHEDARALEDGFEELELDAFVKAKAMELASKAAEGRAVDKVALATELLNDPAVRVKLQKLFKINRRGHMPASDEALNAAAAAGKSMDEIESNETDA